MAATDARGRDVLSTIQTRDGKFLRAYDRRLRKGLVTEHYVELDLGKLDKPQQITLFLTGWINPTDISSNVGIAQNDSLPAGSGPAVWAPDADGNWKQTIPFTGFPGGKTKTIAVDVSNAFLSDDYRLRIVTNQELYWDEIFFTLDEGPGEFREQPLTLVSANLHDRGFSRLIPGTNFGPETFDYQHVSRQPRWAPMRGNFTRYGDVRELLMATDDRLVVAGSGDEITVKFAVPEKPLPAGWKRDFVLYNAGWDKDADLNTIFGQSVEPLPFHGMSKYPYDGPYPNSVRHREYLRDYQTRRQDPRRFWKAIVGSTP